MDEETFNKLLQMVAPIISKEDTHLRTSISATGGCHFEDHVTHPPHDSKTASDWSVFLDTTKHQ